MQFNERIKFLREKENLTQQQMADILDIAKSTYVKYERGEREPRYGTLAAIADYFDVTVDYVLGISDKENKHIERVSDIYEYMESEEFRLAHGANLKNIHKMVSDLLQAVYVSADLPQTLDVLYSVAQIENKMLELGHIGYHIFNYEKNLAEEGEEWKKVVPEPNTDDLISFIKTTMEIRKLVDNYINLSSSKDYYERLSLFYDKEISQYAQINREELIKRFHEDGPYKD